MRIVIAGGHGKIAVILTRLLAARQDSVIGLIRSDEQCERLRAAGSRPLVTDLERVGVGELAEHIAGADAVVFAAGAGAGSGAARKDTVDRGAAVLLGTAAELAGVRRYLLVSAMGADAPPPADADPVFAAYLRAKGAAEVDLRGRELDWTILRPGRLVDGPGSGRVRLAHRVPRGQVPRADAAAVLVGLLDTPGSAGQVLELVAGDTPVEKAVAAYAG